MHKLDDAYVMEVRDEDFRNPWLLEDMFQRLMGKLKRRKLIVDLTGVKTTMSLGVAVLIAAHGLALIHKTRIVFAGVQPGVRRPLELAGADQIIAMYGTMDEALRALHCSPEAVVSAASSGPS